MYKPSNVHLYPIYLFTIILKLECDKSHWGSKCLNEHSTTFVGKGIYSLNSDEII